MPSPFKKSQLEDPPPAGGATGEAAEGSRKSALKNVGAEGPSKIQRVGVAPGSPFPPAAAAASGDTAGSLSGASEGLAGSGSSMGAAAAGEIPTSAGVWGAGVINQASASCGMDVEEDALRNDSVARLFLPDFGTGPADAETDDDKKSGKDDGNMKTILEEMRKINLNIDEKFSSMQATLAGLRSEMTAIKEEMVIRTVFQSLEHRVTALENLPHASLTTSDSSIIQNLRQQLVKLDPAQKSIRVRGFKEETLSDRVSSIEKAIHDSGLKYQNIEHVCKGPPGQRVVTDMLVIEFSSRETREKFLADISKKNLRSSGGNELKFDRAKTTFQLQRNAALRNAMANLKSNPQHAGKTIEIVWQNADRKIKDREVRVGDVPAFRQTINDITGVFVPPFAHHG